MNKIISKERFSEKVFKLEIEAPLIAKSRKAGHFVIVRVGDKGERMPLTIAGSDLKQGTITLVIQEVGLSSTRLCELNEGDYITDVVGPLGQATHIENFGTVVCAGGGVGVAPMLPIVHFFLQRSYHSGKRNARELRRSDYHDGRRLLWPQRLGNRRRRRSNQT